ncbi:Tim44 domain-containing protein [Sphingomonas sp. AAP5]|uniref:Tim44/TimA family putative adaptor protein n=1 Tax=Sphingomonas sp. AAP5 TaxID=1523415 RepID=UPI0010570241|nr:Tim44/TimA family putative adaptor protein [Sphingomonas sp. AAP5]QBM74314.1 Tim44 domain-containing protein [Sphingomonas sp. AAP5]
MFLIVILAMVAGFLALRLYMVLGKRTGHEQPLPKPAEDRAPLTLVQRPTEMPGESREPVSRLVEPKAEAGIRAIIAGDSSFDVARFLDGSKAAYRMILEAFWKGDEEELAWLAEDDVREAFVAAIEARNTAGHVLENRLVSIERAVISDATLEGKVARITVRFDADIAAVTRDAENTVIAGSMSDAVETHDAWTFARTLKSSDPNWKLADTDEA